VSEFFLIVGLGNPGPRYTHNRHNIGFQIVNALALAHRLSFTRVEHRAQTAHGTIAARRVILAKPQTWMNESGKAVVPLSHFYKIDPARMLVVYDDLDIPLGDLRYRPEGSSGGHKGVQSIMQLLGTQALPRLRVGIGRPPGQMDPAAYVLQDFSATETHVVWEVQRLACDLVVAWLNHDPDFERQGMTWHVSKDTG